jgi:hypothetical protein
MKRLERRLAVLFVAALGAAAGAQTVQSARFEVASVKPHVSDDPRVTIVIDTLDPPTPN